MVTPQAAMRKWKTRVLSFEKSAVSRVRDVLQIASVEAGEEWHLDMERRWRIMEDTYDEIMETHPEPNVEEVDARDQEVHDVYSIWRDLMDKAVTAYKDSTIVIASRIGQLKAAARGVRSRPTDAQKAAMLVAKRASVC